MTIVIAGGATLRREELLPSPRHTGNSFHLRQVINVLKKDRKREAGRE